MLKTEGINKTMIDHYYCINLTIYSPKFMKSMPLYVVAFSQSMGGWTFPIIFVPYMNHKIMYNTGNEMHG